MMLVESDASGEWDSSSAWPELAEKSVRAAVAASAERSTASISSASSSPGSWS